MTYRKSRNIDHIGSYPPGPRRYPDNPPSHAILLNNDAGVLQTDRVFHPVQAYYSYTSSDNLPRLNGNVSITVPLAHHGNQGRSV